MSLQMFERQYHKERKARRALEQNIRPLFGWGRFKDDNFPIKVPLRGPESRSPILGSEQEATLWAQESPLGTHYEVIPYHPNGQHLPAGYYARLYERRGAPFRTPSRTWEVQEAERAETWGIVIRKIEQRRFQGSGKGFRRKYIRRRRQYGHQAERLYLLGDDDGGSVVDSLKEQRGILWDIW